MSDECPYDLLDMISNAIGYTLNPMVVTDMMIIQKGCFILNSWGIGPFFEFDLYMNGPYSRDLRRACTRNFKKSKMRGRMNPQDIIKRLSGEMAKTHIAEQNI